MPTLTAMGCCGLRELYIGWDYASLDQRTTPVDAVKFLCQQFSGRKMNTRTREFKATLNLSMCQVVFTQNTKAKDAEDTSALNYGVRLATYITKHKLGSVVQSETAKNPNTSNPITVFVWTLNAKNLRTWWAAHNKSPKKGK